MRIVTKRLGINGEKWVTFGACSENGFMLFISPFGLRINSQDSLNNPHTHSLSSSPMAICCVDGIKNCALCHHNLRLSINVSRHNADDVLRLV